MDNTMEALLAQWEAQREIKNLMGRFTRCLLHRTAGEIPGRFWSSREDISLGTNEGWYLGQRSVARYFDHFDTVTALTDGIMKALFPEIPPEQYGIGYLDMKSLSTDLVEVAGDGNSAKGMWGCAGQKVEYTAAGPVTFLTYGTYAVDFVQENGQFRILHMQYLEELCHRQGEKWWEPEAPLPEHPAFRPVKDCLPPEPDVPVRLWEGYHPERKRPLLPRLPEKYETLEETFSYGPSEEVWL